MNVIPSGAAVQKFEVGEKVRTVSCPSVGVIVEAEKEVRLSCFGGGGRKERWRYRIDWRPDFPNDHQWYAEDELVFPEYEDAFSRQTDNS